MTGTPTSSPSRTSLLYAIGRLSASSDAHKEEIARLRSSQETLPEKVAAYLAPQLVALTSTQEAHGVRLDALERRQWLFVGGAGLATVVIPILIQVWQGR